MRQLTGFTDQPRQESIVTIDDGSRATLRLEYKPNQSGWFISITRGDFVLNGVRLVSSPNILRQWENVIPFGLLVSTTGNAEPLNQSDLADGFCGIYLLNYEELEEVNTVCFPGISSAISGNLLTSRFRPIDVGSVSLEFEMRMFRYDDDWQILRNGVELTNPQVCSFFDPNPRSFNCMGRVGDVFTVNSFDGWSPSWEFHGYTVKLTRYDGRVENYVNTNSQSGSSSGYNIDYSGPPTFFEYHEVGQFTVPPNPS